MTDQEIIGVMEQFYIAYNGSMVSTFFIEHQNEAASRNPALARLLKVSNTELIFSIEDEQRYSSIKPFEDESGTTVYLIGGPGVESEISEEAKEEIKNGLLQPITEKEYLAKYRELDE